MNSLPLKCALISPFFHQVHLIGQIGHIPQPVLGNDHRFPILLHPHDVFAQFRNAVLVKVRRRLAKNVDVGVHSVDAAERDALRLSTGKLEDAAVQQRGQVQIFRGPAKPLFHFLMRCAHAFQAEHHFVGGVQVEKLAFRVLEHRADHLRKFPHFIGFRIAAANVHAAFEDPAIILQEQAVHQAQYGRFPTAALTGEQHRLPFDNGKRHVAQRRGFPSGITVRCVFEGNHSRPALSHTDAAKMAPAATKTSTSCA